MTTQKGNPSLPNDSVRVLVLDAHDPTRLGLGLLLQRQPWVRRCLLARDLGEATRLAAEHRPDVAVVDVSNAGPFAASLLAELRSAHPAVQLVLTSRCAPSDRSPLHALPAAAVLPPAASAAELVRVVQAAVLEEPIPAVALLRRSTGEPLDLTEREREVLTLLGTGATNREIAAQLHLGPDSIKKYATSIYRKLGVRNRTEATQRAIELGAEAA